MPRRPRRLTIPDAGNVVVHCTSRCVRQYRLLGHDPVTGADRSDRRGRLERVAMRLADAFAIDVLALSILENHLHLLLELLRDVAGAWSAEEVVDRWLRVASTSLSEKKREDLREKLLADPAAIEHTRARLCHPADFHRLLKQPLACAANREDGVAGTFWSGRYHARRVIGERQLAVVMQYVDHNQVRAGLAATHEASDHSSIQMRIRMLEVAADNRARREEDVHGASADSPRRRTRRAREIDQVRAVRRRRVVRLTTSRPDEIEHPEDGLRLRPIEPRDGRPGIFAGLRVQDYVAMLDETARRCRNPDDARVDPRTAPIFERLQIDPRRLASLLRVDAPLRGTIFGDAASCAAEAARLGVRSIRAALSLDDVDTNTPDRSVRPPRRHGDRLDDPPN